MGRCEEDRPTASLPRVRLLPGAPGRQEVQTRGRVRAGLGRGPPPGRSHSEVFGNGDVRPPGSLGVHLPALA